MAIDPEDTGAIKKSEVLLKDIVCCKSILFHRISDSIWRLSRTIKLESLLRRRGSGYLSEEHIEPTIL